MQLTFSEDGDIHVTKVNFDLVKKDCNDNGVNTKLFNTSSHPVSDLPQGFDPEALSEKPYSFKRWKDVIRDHRNLNREDEVQHIQLSRSQAQLLVDAAAVSIVTEKISLAHKEDLEEILYPVLTQVATDQRGIFLRLNDCSPKDGVQSEDGVSIHTIGDLILRLTTSKRARNAVVKDLADGAETIDLFCLPFDGRFNAAKEYRVFCCPGTGKITGVSQYQWHKPWIYAHVPEKDRLKLVGSLMTAIDDVHALIMSALKRGVEQDERFLKQGFTFNVVFDPDLDTSGSSCEIQHVDCALVELNVFGARSACGSCLFHWIADMDLLYGKTGGTEFRFTC